MEKILLLEKNYDFPFIQENEMPFNPLFERSMLTQFYINSSHILFSIAVVELP